MKLPPALVLLVCIGAACGTSEGESPLPNTIRVGYSHEPPYAFVDDTGGVSGESPEVLRVVADRLGIYDVRWVRLDFDELIPSLLEGRIDVVASGMYATEARSASVRFSQPTLCTQPALVVRDDGPAPDGIDAADAVGQLRIAVLAGSVEEGAAQALGLPPERILTVYDLPTAIAAVRRGAAGAFAVTLPTARRLLEDDTLETLRVIGPYDPPAGAESLAGCGAFAFRPEDETLAAAADCVLTDFVGTTEHLALVSRFGFDEASIPEPASSRTPAGPDRCEGI